MGSDMAALYVKLAKMEIAFQGVNQENQELKMRLSKLQKGGKEDERTRSNASNKQGRK